MNFTHLKQQERKWAAVLLLSIGPGKHAMPFEDHHVKRRIRHLMLCKLIPSINHQAKDAHVLINKERILERKGIEEYKLRN